jgi:GNAT superfamily N-acetyltransferase
MSNTNQHKIRVATWDDAPQLWQLAWLAHRENGLFPLSQPKVKQLLTDLIDQRRGVVAVIGGTILEACVWVTIGEGSWYTTSLSVADALLFVHPDYRGGLHAVRLLAWMKRFARDRQLPWMTAVVSKRRTQAKCKLYRKVGLRPVGEVYFEPRGEDNGRIVPVAKPNKL